MIRLFLFTFVFLIGLSMAIVKSELKFRNIHQKRFSRNNEEQRSLRHLMGKLMDTETNTIYTMDGQRQQDIPLKTDATITPASVVLEGLPSREEIACLAACNSCIEEYPLESRMKRAADNCGPMCDCADSCFVMSIEQVGRTYGQNSNAGNDKDCWWKTYTEMLSNGLSSSA